MRVLPESAVRYLPLDDSAHTRQPGLWLRRRARRLARFYDIDRREALRAALLDRRCFMPQLRPVLRVMRGGAA